jgi:hypothetical protein
MEILIHNLIIIYLSYLVILILHKIKIQLRFAIHISLHIFRKCDSKLHLFKLIYLIEKIMIDKFTYYSICA